MEEVQLAQSDEQIMFCFPVMFELRPHLRKEKFLEQINRMMKEGYFLAFIEADNKAVVTTGFRFEEMLYRGKSIYVDDLVTLPEYRSKGYGAEMIDWIIDYARKNNCEQVHLDSGVQRFDAHRFYLNKGFFISSHHFQLNLNKAR